MQAGVSVSGRWHQRSPHRVAAPGTDASGQGATFHRHPHALGDDAATGRVEMVGVHVHVAGDKPGESVPAAAALPLPGVRRYHPTDRKLTSSRPESLARFCEGGALRES